MTHPFPDTPTYTGHDAPLRMETDIFDLEIVGELPAGLNGTWYRVGPDPQYPPMLGDDIPISGDGMITRFRFGNGHVDFKSRYVQTEKLKAERAARRSLFGTYRNPYTDDPSVRFKVDRATVNTTALCHGGVLLSMKEDSRPYALDPETLETIGVHTWGGNLKSQTMTAHPKIDARTGELFFYGYEAGGLATTDISFCVADASGKLIREEWFKAPYAAMVHDFAITEDFVIFPIFPTIAELDRLKAGGLHWVSDMSRDAYIGIMPRKGTVRDMRWFRHKGCFAYHVINAWNEGPVVHMDHCLAQINPFPFVPDVSGEPYDPMKATTMATRWSFDLSKPGESFEERVIGPGPVDLPRIDDRLTGLPYRYAYMGLLDPQRPIHKSGPVGGGFNMVCRLDVHTGQVDTWYGDDMESFQEPQFVPVGPGETDGYVLCAIDNHALNRGEIGVFEPKNFARGPIARVRMPTRLRLAIHGSWVPK